MWWVIVGVIFVILLLVGWFAYEVLRAEEEPRADYYDDVTQDRMGGIA